MKDVTLKIVYNDLQPLYGTSISELYEKLAQERAKAIDEEIMKLGVTTDNAKNYHIDVIRENNQETYKIYKKEFIGEFVVGNTKLK